MKKIITPCGWYAYETKPEEVISWGGLCICDTCGEFHPEGGYLVPVLNHWLCKSCFEEWKGRAKYYEEDKWYEEIKMKYYETIIKIE